MQNRKSRIGAEQSPDPNVIINAKEIRLLSIDKMDENAIRSGYEQQTDFYRLTSGHEVGLRGSDAAHYIENAINERRAGTAYRYGISTENSMLVGVAEIHKINWIHRRCELGIQIWNPMNREKGIGRAAIKQLIEIAEKRLGLRRAAALVISNNIQSLKLFHSCGFLQEGILRDYIFINGEHRDAVLLSKILGEK
jgi:RimJ/RimL family protein N-acetyltransferase